MNKTDFVLVFLVAIAIGIPIYYMGGWSTPKQNPVPATSQDTKQYAISYLTSVENMEKTFDEHRILAQFYRWFLYYESAEKNLTNQLDILSRDVTVKSSFGWAKSRAEYEENVKKIPVAWQNAHHVKTTSIKKLDNNQYSLNAEIQYYNLGYAPDGKIATTLVNYSALLDGQGGVLPHFLDIKTEASEPIFVSEFKDAYDENRLRSLAHYWLALIEQNDGDATPFRELLTQDFDIRFSTGPIKTFDEFSMWFSSVSTMVLKSSHTISAFEYTKQTDGTYKLTMEFDWHGFGKEHPEIELEAKTRHEWIVQDNQQDRFPKIKSIDVTVLKPFAPVKK